MTHSTHTRPGRRVDHTIITIITIATTLLLACSWPSQAGDAVVIPPPDMTAPTTQTVGPQTAVLAGGCFWGMEAVFQHVEGVLDVVSGYSGGDKGTAHYRMVGGGETAHAEAVKITFNADKISYAKLLQIYFSVAHDPTQLNHQGADVGTQYRSNIFYADPAQKRIAQSYIRQLDDTGQFDRPIVTQIDPLTGFYPAEDYHQNFAYLHPNRPYIVIVDLPKIRHLETTFPELYRAKPVIEPAQ